MPVSPTLATADFTPTSIALLFAGGVVGIVLAIAFMIRFATSFPALPSPGPETSDLGRDPEPPAIANLLVNRCNVTSSAAAATLIDLAARGHLELSEVGPERFVVRLRRAADEPLTEYEEQVIDLVRQRATGGSAPLEAIELDESQATGWRERFAKRVMADAKARGLLRGRWTPADWIGFGLLAAVVLSLLAAGLYAANVHEASKNGGNSFDREDWFFVALAAWLGVLAVLRSLRSVRYSAAGDAAAARWLGVKRNLSHDKEFGDVAPAGVAIWDRLLAYGAALGVARGAAAAIPLEVEDPDVAWSRVGGDWHQVHVEYPRRFGYGERPLSVLGNGLLRSLLWGAVAFLALPIVVDIVWKEGSDAFGNTGKAPTFGFVVALAVFTAVFGAIGAFVLVRLADGLIRVFRGAADLRATLVMTGQVVKHHHTEESSWFAVDPGDVDEVRALHPGDDGETPRRGATVRVVMTPHLRHVVSVDVIDDAESRAPSTT
jgi:hypothetical protein